MRVVALLAAYNEERFIGACLEHLAQQGVEAYLIDNDSTDRTVEIARRWLGSTLLGLERFRRERVFRWRKILKRKEQLARKLDADWFMHMDPDEIRLSPDPKLTLAEAFRKVEDEGYNAVNFQEFTFVPTRESPDHDHPDFKETMRWYYPFLPFSPHQLKAWKRQSVKVELVRSAGHGVMFPGLRIYPAPFPMRHYLFLSEAHALRKYGARKYDPVAVRSGWHGWRATVGQRTIRLPSQDQLRYYTSDAGLDARNPCKRHCLDEGWEGVPV